MFTLPTPLDTPLDCDEPSSVPDEDEEDDEDEEVADDCESGPWSALPLAWAWADLVLCPAAFGFTKVANAWAIVGCDLGRL